ncbi:MAG: glycosyltransferase family 4 protein [Gemmatimonadota bacterium]
MRLLLCSDTYPPQVNGVSVVSALMAEGLRDRGWQCATVVPAYPASLRSPLDAPRIPRFDLPSVPMPIYPALRLPWPSRRTVREAFDAWAPDLVYCATEFVIGRLAAAEARRRGVPLVSAFHTDFGRYAAAYGVPWLRRAVEANVAAFQRRAALTLTPSTPAMATLRAAGVTRAEIWGRGVEPTRFTPTRRSLALREALSLGPAFTFLYVGRLAPEKTVALVLRAFAALAGSLAPGAVRLIVAGDGPSLPALRRQAGPGVTFLGSLERDHDLPTLFASCDAFVFASETETLGLVVLEAMASGLPVIAASAGGVADHLRDEVNGLAFASGDKSAMLAAMCRLVRDRALRERLRAGALRTAAPLSWAAELDRLDTRFRTLVRTAPTAHAPAAPMGAVAAASA